MFGIFKRFIAGARAPLQPESQFVVRKCFTRLIVALCLLTNLRANVPGGGSGGANVTLADNGSTVVLANGIVTAMIVKAQARITSLTYNGNQMVDPKGLYWSMDGGKSYQNPVRCVFRVVTQTPEMVDVSCQQIYAKGDAHPTDIDIHYVLRQGNTPANTTIRSCGVPDGSS